MGFEFYPGVNLVYNKIIQASINNDPSEIEKALKLADMVYLSTEKAGGILSNDFWALATMLETSVLSGKQTDKILAKVIEKASAEWEIQAPIDNLKKLKDQLQNMGDKLPSVKGIQEKIDSVLIHFEGKSKALTEKSNYEFNVPENETREEKSLKKITEQLFNKGFSYGEITTFIGGNIEYGGQLHSHTVNRWDISVARSVIEHLGLKNSTNFSEFNKSVDQTIRQRYGTEGLEDLQSSDHEKFDEFMKSFNDVMRVGKQDDSRTNVMVDFFLGKGDCRQHAYTKQLLFDVWKTDIINQHMGLAYEANKKGNDESYKENMEKAQKWVNTSMLVFDSTIKAEIEMEQKYKTKKNEKNELISSSEMQEVEDHTWNALITLDKNKIINTFTMVDSFYQGVYSFGGEKTGQDGTSTAGVSISLENVTEEGIRGDFLEAVDPTTGATLIEARKVLLKSGARRVIAGTPAH